MKIQIRADKVIIDGYVNAVERASKPLISRFGQFIEKICAGAFGRALKRNEDVRILLNHNPERDLGGTGTGELELTEDAIGLRAHAELTDKQVIEDARAGNLVGWSFGFCDRAVDITQDSVTGLPFRMVKDLDLYEVSLLNREKTPAYDGTLVSVRSAEGDEKQIYTGENRDDEIEGIEELTEARNNEEATAEAIAELRADEIVSGTLPAEEAKPAEANNPDTKSYDNSKYINIVAELKTLRDSVK